MPPSLASSVTRSSTCAKQLCNAAQPSRSFSTTLRQEARTTRARKGLFRWLASQGECLRNPLEGSTNYLGAYNKDGKLKRVVTADKEDDGKKRNSKSSELPPESARDRVPFPLNPQFVSEPVLSEAFRYNIWRQIMQEGKSVREVSVAMKVEMARVGAVVRLMEVELEWQRIRKPMAKPYAAAIMSMLPQTQFNKDEVDADRRPHESINDLPVHALTGPQIFHPTSESRKFTRADAARVFSEKLLPADDRIPHPDLVIQHREALSNMTEEERIEANKQREAVAEEKRQKAALKQSIIDSKVKKVDHGRWEFRFTEANVDAAGKDGRGHSGVGWRYGMPHYDRNRGLIKIPKSVA